MFEETALITKGNMRHDFIQIHRLKSIHWKFRLALSRIKKAVNKLSRWALEPLGISVFSKPARYGMDDKLAHYLPDCGMFIEAGATDGFSESNT